MSVISTYFGNCSTARSGNEGTLHMWSAVTR
jgi:hypothetical protein